MNKSIALIKSDGAALPKLWTSNFILICLSSLFNGLAFQSLITSLPIYIVQQLNGSTSIAGLAMAILTISAIIMRPFAGFALDTFGRKALFAIGLIVFMLPSIGFIFLVPFSILLVLRFIQGLGWGISHTAVGTVASDIVPPERMAEGMGTFNITGSFASVLAPAMSLWLINQFSFRILFLVIALLSLVSLAFAQAIKYHKFEAHPEKPKLELFDRKATRPALVILLVAIAFSAVLSFLALFARGLGINNPGLFFVLSGVTTILSRPLVGRLVDRLGQRGYDLVLLAAIPLMGLSLWLISVTGANWHLALSGAIFGIGNGTIQSTMLAMCIKLLPHKRGSANAIYGLFLDLGTAIGSIMWGIVANYAGFQVMFRLTIIPVAMALLIYFWGSGKENAGLEGR